MRHVEKKRKGFTNQLTQNFSSRADGRNNPKGFKISNDKDIRDNTGFL